MAPLTFRFAFPKNRRRPKCPLTAQCLGIEGETVYTLLHDTMRPTVAEFLLPDKSYSCGAVEGVFVRTFHILTFTVIKGVNTGWSSHFPNRLLCPCLNTVPVSESDAQTPKIEQDTYEFCYVPACPCVPSRFRLHERQKELHIAQGKPRAPLLSTPRVQWPTTVFQSRERCTSRVPPCLKP